jgi:hypothetical protein
MAELRYDYHPLWNVLNKGKPYEPFAYQAQHLHSKVDAGFKRIILGWGRRAGKSTATIAEVVREVTRPAEVVEGVEQFPIVYIVGPTAEASMRVWEPIWNAFVPSEDGSYVPPFGMLHVGHDKNRGVIFIRGGGRIYRKSGESPAAMQGERVTLAVTDESQDMPEDVWQNLMPSLLDSDGRLIAIGITRGRGRFRSYWHAGQKVDAQFYSCSIPSTESPVLRALAAKAGKPVLEWLRETAEEDLTDDEFTQQYLAQWIDGDGAVFHRFESLFTGTGERAAGPHIMGLDIGKLHDFTVVYVGDVAKQEFVYRERFNKIDYLDQVPRIAKIAREWNCRFVHMDATGVGEAVAEMLRAERVPVVPFKFTNESKQALVSKMVREVERGNITFLADDDVLKREMTLFEGTVSPGGVIKYSAPPGFFDDCVMSAALLIQKMARNKTMAKNPIHKPYVSFGKKPRSLVGAA